MVSRGYRNQRARRKVAHDDKMWDAAQWRAAILERSGGWCEAPDGWCLDEPVGRRHQADHVHHIRLRSQGGGNTMENGIAICHAGHERVHRNPAEAAKHGLIARMTPDPNKTTIVAYVLGNPTNCRQFSDDVPVHWYPPGSNPGDTCYCGRSTMADREDEW